MGIVVDVGCMEHDGESSIPKLLDRFHPEVLFGFDPHPDFQEGVLVLDGSCLVLSRQAAGTRDRIASLAVDGLRTSLTEYDMPTPHPGTITTTRVFNFARWFRLLPECPTVLKLDCEGAEFTILRMMLSQDLDLRLDLLLVEWHDDKLPGFAQSRRWLERELRCEIEPWG